MLRASRLGLAIASGFMLFMACPDFDLWPLMWVALVPALHLALTAATPKRAFFLGWLTGVVANTGGFYWMKGLLERFGHMPVYVAIPIMMLLTTYQGVTFAFWSWGVHRAHRRTALPLFVLAPLIMVTLELLVPQIFPFYLAISQAWIVPLIQVADLTGPMGVTFLMLMMTGALYDAAARWRAGAASLGRALRPVAIAGLVIAAVVGYGFLRISQVQARRESAPKADVGLVQANVGILEKWDPAERAGLLETHQRLSSQLAAAGADLVVWPESSYPYPLSRSMTRDFDPTDARRIRRGFSTPLMFGTVTVESGAARGTGSRYPYNTALMMDAGGNITATFDKVFLLVFGEYIPFYEQAPWFRKVFPEASHFNRGSEPASFPVNIDGREFRIGPLICYEDILPGFTRRVAKLRPHLFVNITNDAWFGRTSEPYQHLALSVFRSVEHRLEMVRAVNTGVSAHIDATGRVRRATPSADPQEQPPPQPIAIMNDVALLEGGTVYAAVGDTFAWLCALTLAALVARLPRHRALAGGYRKKNG